MGLGKMSFCLPLATAKSLTERLFLNKGSRCLIPLWSSEQQKGADSQPQLGDTMGLFFQQCLANHLHLTSGAERWIFCNSVLLFDVHGQEQILHPSYLGYLYTSCIGQLFILYFECFIYVCLHNVEVSTSDT